MLLIKDKKGKRLHYLQIEKSILDIDAGGQNRSALLFCHKSIIELEPDPSYMYTGREGQERTGPNWNFIFFKTKDVCNNP